MLGSASAAAAVLMPFFSGIALAILVLVLVLASSPAVRSVRVSSSRRFLLAGSEEEGEWVGRPQM